MPGKRAYFVQTQGDGCDFLNFMKHSAFSKEKGKKPRWRYGTQTKVGMGKVTVWHYYKLYFPCSNILGLVIFDDSCY